MNYKDDQKATREALKSYRVIEGKPPSMRKYARQKMVDRKFTKKGFSFGRKIGSKEDNMIHHLAKIQGDK